MTKRLTPILLVAGAALLSACAGEARSASAAAATAGVVDSALPIPVLLDRFRATTVDTPTVLRGGAASPRDLVEALVGALATHDTATLRSLVLSRAEFAWLYYPHTKFTSRPYELGPELVWLQHAAASEKGAVRLLSRYGGAVLGLRSVTCADSAVSEGPNRIVGGCRVRLTSPEGAVQERRLFGALLNRDGRYKFLSYANDL